VRRRSSRSNNLDGAPTGIVGYAPLDKTSHHRNVTDLEKQSEPAAPAPGASVVEVMLTV